MTALTAALSNRGSATRDWAVGWLQRSGMTKAQANAEVDRSKASGEVVEHEGVLVPAVKPNPMKGRSMRPVRTASKQADLARARAKLAEKRVQVSRQAKVKPPAIRSTPKPRAMSLAQMVEHNRRTAAKPASSKLVRQPTRTNPRHQENPMAKRASQKLTSAQKKALAEGRKLVAQARASAKAAPKKATSKKASKPKSRKKATSKQLRALAKARAARAANRAATVVAAPKAPTPKKRTSRKAPSKRKSAKKARKSRVVVARTAIARATRALAPAPRPRKPGAKRRLSKTIRSGTYQNKAGQAIVVRRTYKSNPVVEFRQIALAGGGLALGWIAAEMADRYVATRAPKPATEGAKTEPLRDQAAKDAIQKLADGTRLLVSGGGTLAFGLGAYMLRDRAPDVAYAVGGLGAGFGIKFFSQILGDVIFPAIFKIKSDDPADSYARRMFPDKQKPAETPAVPTGTVTGRVGAGWGNWGPNRKVFYPGQPAFKYAGFTGAPQGQGHYPFVDAPAQTAVGPVATGAVGCGCRSSVPRGCGADMMPSWGAGCQTCAQPPVPVPVPDGNGNGNGSEEPGFTPWPFSIVETPPGNMYPVELVDQGRTTPQVQLPQSPVLDLGDRAVAVSTGNVRGPQEQPEQAEQAEQAEQPAQQISGTAAIMSLMNRRRRA